MENSLHFCSWSKLRNIQLISNTNFIILHLAFNSEKKSYNEMFVSSTINIYYLCIYLDLY